MQQLNSRKIIPRVFAILVIDGVIGSLVFPVFPEFVKGRSHPELWFGFGTLLFALMQLLFAPVLGRLSDQKGRSPVFRLAALGTTLAMLLLIPITLPLFLINRVSDGATNGLYAVVKSAIVDVSPPEDVQKNVGLSLSISYLGFLIGPGIAYFVLRLADALEWNRTRALVFTGLGFAVVNIVLSLVLPETRAGDNPHVRIKLLEMCKEASPVRLGRQLQQFKVNRPKLFGVLVLQSLVTLSIGYYSYFVIFAAQSPIRLDSKGIALIFLYFALLGVFSNTFFFAKVLTKVPPLPTIRIMLFIGIVVVAAYGIWGGRSLPALYATLTVDMLTVSLVPALIEGFVGKSADESERGELFGISQGIAALMAVVAAILATVLSAVDLRLPFAAFGLATAAAFVWSLRIKLPTAVTGVSQ